MKVVGLDTSFVVRLLMGVPEDQFVRAREFLEELHAKQAHAIVSDLVVAETNFALTYHYQVPKHEAMKRMMELLESGYVFPAPAGVALDTLKAGARSKAGFVDQLIRNQYLSQVNTIVTFDSDFGRLEKVLKLKVSSALPPRSGG